MSRRQWRIFWVALIVLIVLLIGIYPFLDLGPPDPAYLVHGFEQFRLGDKYEEHATPGLSLAYISEQECYFGGVDWSLGGRQYPINARLTYNRRHRLSRIELSIDALQFSDEELETMSELARNYFSSRYHADTMEYTKDPATQTEVIRIRGRNKNVVTVTFGLEAISSIVVAPAE